MKLCVELLLLGMMNWFVMSLECWPDGVSVDSVGGSTASLCSDDQTKK